MPIKTTTAMKRETVLDVTLLRLHLANKTLPEEGLFRAEELFSLNLDYSEQSLADLNELLDQLRSEGYRPENFVSHPASANFLIMIAIYLCDNIAYRTAEKIEWFNYYEATARLPAEYALPQGFFSSMVAIINHQVCLPFLVIEDLLSEPRDNSRNCVSYVAERAAIISKTQINNPNELAKDYLAALQQRKIIPGGNFYKTLTDCIDFDYSLRSIEEIDRMLLCIREHERLSAKDYSAFTQQPDKANFLVVIAFYLGMTIARHSRLPIQWFSFQDYLQQFSKDKKLKYRFDIHYVFSLENQLYYPLQFLKEILFTDQLESITCLEYVELAVPKQMGYLKRYPIIKQSTYSKTSITPLQRKIFYDAGFLAAYALYMVIDGDHFVPTISAPRSDGPSDLIRLTSNLPEIEGLDYLQNNPKHRPYQIYSEDTYAHLDTGRSDAIRLEIRNYTGDTFKLSLVIPYQAHSEYRVGKILNAVRYNATSLNENQLEAALAEFYESAAAFISPISQKSLWNEFFEEDLQLRPSQKIATKDFLLIQQRRFKTALNTIQPSLHQKTSPNFSCENEIYHNHFSDIHIQDEIFKLPKKYRRYLQVEIPQWLIGDELYKQVLAMPALYQQGHVVWGCVVDTPESMYHAGDEHCVGEIIYDPTGRTTPAKLSELAQQLYQLRGKKARHPDQVMYIQHANTEHSRLSYHPYPASLSEYPVRISNIWFWRDHLPNGMLSMTYFPIVICHDEKHLGQAMVLPAWFWPKKLRDEWLTISLKKMGKNLDLTTTLFKNLEDEKHKNHEESLGRLPNLSLIFQEFDIQPRKKRMRTHLFKRDFSTLSTRSRTFTLSAVALFFLCLVFAL
jgi:hypothetical protein